MTRTFTITCYGKAKIYRESQHAKMTREFQTAILSCEGSETKRYSNIYQGLIVSEKECMDTKRPLASELETMLKEMFKMAN